MATTLSSPTVRFGLLVAGVLMLAGAPRFYSGPSGESVEKCKATQKWPHVQGIVTTSKVISESSKRYYVPMVEYRYKVGVTQYEGGSIRAVDGTFATEADARDEMKGFTPGVSVNVFYNPEDPTVSVLRTGAGTRVFTDLIVPGIMAVSGVGLLALAVYSFVRKTNPASTP